LTIFNLFEFLAIWITITSTDTTEQTLMEIIYVIHHFVSSIWPGSFYDTHVYGRILFQRMFHIYASILFIAKSK